VLRSVSGKVSKLPRCKVLLVIDFQWSYDNCSETCVVHVWATRCRWWSHHTANKTHSTIHEGEQKSFLRGYPFQSFGVLLSKNIIVVELWCMHGFTPMQSNSKMYVSRVTRCCCFELKHVFKSYAHITVLCFTWEYAHIWACYIIVQG